LSRAAQGNNMGLHKDDKWYDRAQEYQRILLTQGLRPARLYLERFSGKIDKLLAALWEVHLDDVNDGVVHRRRHERILSKVIRSSKKKQTVLERAIRSTVASSWEEWE
jgi:hypothetical protein